MLTVAQHATLRAALDWLDSIRRWVTPQSRRIAEPGLWIAIRRNSNSFLDAPAPVDSLGSRLTAGLRLALSLTLLLSAADPWDTAPLPPVVVGAISAYVAYAVVACLAALRQSIAADTLALYFPADAAVFLLLTALTDPDDHSMAYSALYFFLLVVMTASFAWGTRAGQNLTMLTGGLFCTVMLVRGSTTGEWETSRMLLRLTYLLALGTMAARWGGHQFTVVRRLALLRDVGGLSNPRFGVDRMIETLLERLQKFYDAGICLLVAKNSEEERGWSVHTSSRHGVRNVIGAEGLSEELGKGLQWLPQDALAVYTRWPQLSWLGAPAGCTEHWHHAGTFGDGQAHRPTTVDSLLARLGGHAWLTVPIYSGSRWLGRLHITREREFNPSDAEFARQVIERGMAAIENIRLVDGLASIAAERERQRIAGDIHDSVIQPYIGLQLGLAAVQRRLSAGDREAAQDEVGRLLGLSAAAIEQLRERVGALKSETGVGDHGLIPALRRYAAHFAEESGIAIEIIGAEAVRCGDRLGAELFQMIVEGLSNIRRHTTTTHAAIRFLPGPRHITLQVENRDPTNVRAAAFMPKSISERAAALGGHVTVDHRRPDRTIVEVRIPL